MSKFVYDRNTAWKRIDSFSGASDTTKQKAISFFEKLPQEILECRVSIFGDCDYDEVNFNVETSRHKQESDNSPHHILEEDVFFTPDRIFYVDYKDGTEDFDVTEEEAIKLLLEFVREER